ncbi:MAG: hypothetical protein ACK50Y_02055 [Flavobacteriia bacterium]
MKRTGYIALFSLILLMASCQKEVIVPAQKSDTSDELMLRSRTVVNNSEESVAEDDGLANDGGITDPKSDKDESSRRRQ